MGSPRPTALWESDTQIKTVTSGKKKQVAEIKEGYVVKVKVALLEKEMWFFQPHISPFEEYNKMEVLFGMSNTVGSDVL